MTPWRQAPEGDLCTCGRPAVEVFVRADGAEVGYCGRSDGGDKKGPCPFCGGRRHELGPCPSYTVRRSDTQANGG
jgi:hypothetical protein